MSTNPVRGGAREVGRVVALWRYPVKSMAAEPLEEVDVGWHGLAGDRRWAFVREGQTRSGFPWLTIRERADLLHHRPRLTDPAEPDDSTVLVRTPGGAEHEIDDPALAAHLGGARLLKQDRGVFDTLPISLLTTQSVDRLGQRVGRSLDPERFRPNLLVDTGGEPFAEDAWVGHVIRIGELRMRVDKRDQRCVVITIDRATLERDPAVLKTLGREREACVGVYGTTVEPGRVAVGDPVLVES